MTLRTVLAATDFSEYSETAARTAYSIALRHSARLVLYHVSELNELLLGGPAEPAYLPPDLWTRLWERERESIREQLAGLQEKVAARPEDGIAITTAFDRGEPVAKILGAAEARKADLIVIGAHGASGSLRYLFGSVAARVSRGARCPVLVTRPGRAGVDAELGTFSRPVIAVDYSPASDQLAQLVRALMAPDAEPLCVHVWDKAFPSVPDEDFAAEVERAKLGQTHRMREFLQKNQLAQAEARIELGKPGRVILDYAAEHEADLIAVGAHSRHGVERILGTTADRVLRHAQSSVLLVPVS